MPFFPSCCWIELGFTSGLSSCNFGAVVCETFKINGPFGGKCQTRSNEPWLSWWMGGLPLKESWVAIKTDSINHCKPHQAMTLAWPWLRYVSFPWLPWWSFFFFSWTNQDILATGSHGLDAGTCYPKGFDWTTQGWESPVSTIGFFRHQVVTASVCLNMALKFSDATGTGHVSEYAPGVWVSIPNTPKIMLSRSHFNMTMPILATSGLRDAEKQQGTVPRTHQWQVQKHTRWRRTTWRRGSWEMGDLRLMRTPFDA